MFVVDQNFVVDDYDTINSRCKNKSDGEAFSCKKNDLFRDPQNCDFITTDKREILNHIRFGHGNLYCHKCSFSASSENEIELHLHYQNLISTLFSDFQCDCGHTTNSFLQYIKHKHEVHLGQSLINCENEIDEDISADNYETNIYSEIKLNCDVCNFETSDIDEFNVHQEFEANQLFLFTKSLMKLERGKVFKVQMRGEVVTFFRFN